MKFNLHYMLLIAVLVVTLLPNASAFGETKEAISTGGKYPDILIRNWFDFPLISSDVMRLTLVSNTERCSDDCEAIIKVENYKPFTFDKNFDLAFFNEKTMKSMNMDYAIEIATTKKTISELISVDCHEDNKLETANKTICISTYKNKTIDDYNPLDSKIEMKTGNFLIRIRGNKDYRTSVEWIPTLLGLNINEWANWNATGFGDGLRGYWAMNDTVGGTFASNSINPALNNGTISSSSAFMTGGKNGNALFCAGAGGTGRFATPAITHSGTQQSMGAWVYANLTGDFDDPGSGEVLFGRFQTGVDFTSRFSITSNGTIGLVGAAQLYSNITIPANR